MRILLAADVMPHPDSGAAGTEYHTIQALRYLGHDVDEIWAGDLPHRVRHGNLHYVLELPRGFRDAIRQRWVHASYDAVHVNQPHAYLAAQDHVRLRRKAVFVNRSHGLEARVEPILDAWKKRLGQKERFGIRTLPRMLIASLLQRSQRLVAAYATGHIVSCSEDKEFLIQRYGVAPERVACIPQAPYDGFVSIPAPPVDPERLNNLIHVGQVVLYKDPYAIAAAVDALLAENPSARFTWICPKCDVEKAASLLSPSALKRSRLAAGIPQEELRLCLDRSGVFLFPSITEGFGKAFIEAMSRGLCVVATRTAGMRDIIRDGENGFFVDVHDVQGIIRVVRHLWSNPDLAMAVGRAARATSEEYSWDRLARETAAFYERLLTMKELRP